MRVCVGKGGWWVESGGREGVWCTCKGYVYVYVCEEGIYVYENTEQGHASTNLYIFSQA